jgi:hypothetical protein
MLHCNAAGGGYAWLDSVKLDQEQSLTTPSSYAGVILGPMPPLLPLVVPPSPSLTHSYAPLVLCSYRIADMAELTGGREACV